VNKKAGKRTKAAKELPFVSRDWWPLDKTRGYCHKHMGDYAPNADRVGRGMMVM